MTTSKKNPFCLSEKHLFLFCFFAFECGAALKAQTAPPPLNLTAVTGVSVELRCKVRLQDCGNFYSIEWYRDNNNNNVVHDNNVNTNDDDDDENRRLKTSDATSRGKRETRNQFLNFKSSEFGNNESSKLRPKRQPSESYETPANVESERVYVYRHHSGLAKSEGSWESRAEHQYDAKRHVMTIRFQMFRLKKLILSSFPIDVLYT